VRNFLTKIQQRLEGKMKKMSKLNQEKKTKKTFKDKWENNPDLAFSETLNEKSEIFNWILNRNGFKNVKEFEKYLSNKTRILDAGCGNGRVTALLRKYSDANKTEIVAADLVPVKIAQKNLKHYHLDQNIRFIQADLMKSLKKLGKFDFIYCQEVLHHTKNPKKAFSNLVEILTPKGEIAIYVYKKKSPAREYIDDYIRARISHLSYKDAIKVCEQITDFGKALSEPKLKITIPAVDILDIQAGEFDLQRFIYYFFMKCFWNKNLTFQENVAINFDWYHPELCARYTLGEVRKWFVDSNLMIIQECVDAYGITMRGKRTR